MGKMPELYPDQQIVLNQILNLIKNNNRRILLCAETGSGKTTIASRLMLYFIKTGSPCLFIVGDDPLIYQTKKTADKFGIRSGIIKADIPEDRKQPLQIASIYSLINRQLPPAELIIFDEAHESYAASFRGVIDYYYNRGGTILGLTATPYRTNPKEGLGEIYDHMVVAPRFGELVEMKRLSPPTYYGFDPLDLSQVRLLKNGDYNLDDLNVLCNTDRDCVRIVQEWLNRASERKTIAFTICLEHSQRLQQAFLNYGINAVTVDSETSTEDRRCIYEEFARGSLTDPQVIISVDVLEKGFDEPSVGCIIQARPTKSKIKNNQQLGRGARTFPGKKDFIVIDYAGNIYRHDFITNQTMPQLTKGGGKVSEGVAPVKCCPREKGGCGLILPLAVMECKGCGYKFPPKQKLVVERPLAQLVPALPSTRGEINEEERMFFVAAAQTAYKRDLPPGGPIAQFQEKFNKLPDSNILRGAIFGVNPSDRQKQEYQGYLQRQAIRQGKDRNWIDQYLKLEFG